MNYLAMQLPDMMYQIVESMKKRMIEGQTDQRPGVNPNAKNTTEVKWGEVERFVNIPKYFFWNWLQSLAIQHAEFSVRDLATWDRNCRDQARRLSEAVSGVYGNVFIDPDGRSDVVVIRSLNMLVTWCNLQVIVVGTKVTNKSTIIFVCQQL